MGYSSINASLTYLRGLEIAELKEEDMPNIKTPAKSKGLYTNYLAVYWLRVKLFKIIVLKYLQILFTDVVNTSNLTKLTLQ